MLEHLIVALIGLAVLAYLARMARAKLRGRSSACCQAADDCPLAAKCATGGPAAAAKASSGRAPNPSTRHTDCPGQPPPRSVT